MSCCPARTTLDTCYQCHATSSSPMSVCARCVDKIQHRITYCSRECQVAHYPSHKPYCGGGKLYLAPNLQATDYLIPQVTMLGNCNDPSLAYYYLRNIGSPAPTQKDGGALSRTASYVPIHIPTEDQATQALIRVLREPLFLERNLVSLTLLYSLLSPYLPEATASDSETLGANAASLDGNDQDSNWIRQLSLEYSIDLQKVLDEEQEPDEQQLMQAIGGKSNFHVLLDWQLLEAERSR